MERKPNGNSFCASSSEKVQVIIKFNPLDFAHSLSRARKNNYSILSSRTYEAKDKWGSKCTVYEAFVQSND